MNKAFLVIFVPAVVTSFLWLTFGWGWRLAVEVTAAELAFGIAAVIYLQRRQSARRGGPEANR
jgi:hypothetical protein